MNHLKTEILETSLIKKKKNTYRDKESMQLNF